MITAHEIKEILNIGIEITTEKNKNRLLEKMLDKAMEIAGCDAGTLYVLKDGCLHFKIMKTLSMGVDRGGGEEEIDLPPVPLKEENVCAYSAIHREMINVPDVYSGEKFDFSGPRKYDAMTGYHTKSMLVIPMEDAEEKVIGVLQLINKLDAENRIISFDGEDAFVLRSLGSMAAVSLSNMIYLEELKLQMQSFVQAFATAIDKRTPYNGSHTRKVTEYAILVAKRLNELYECGKGGEPFDAVRIEQLSLAAGLHDIGKMIVPLSIMNKSTRLDGLYQDIEKRFAYLRLLYERDLLRGDLSQSAYEDLVLELERDQKRIALADTAGFLSDELLAEIEDVAAHYYCDKNGVRIPYLTEEELVCLRIRKGTLTADERGVMENHVRMTSEILKQVYLTDSYKDALRFAGEHHEFLDGSGYPNHLQGEELSCESRILTVVDIFDALTCTDRPYKKPIQQERAISILKEMVTEGKLDGTIVSALEDVTRA